MSRRLTTPSSQSWETSGLPVAAWPLTFACWYRPWSLAGIATPVAFWDGVASSSAAFGFRVGTAGTVTWNTWNGTSNTTGSTVSGFAAAVGQWCHVGAVYASDTSKRAAANGMFGPASASSYPFPAVTKIEIGRFHTTSAQQGCRGDIAHAAVWSAALTARDFANLYAGAMPWEVQPLALQAYWPMTGQPGAWEPDLNPAAPYRWNLTPQGSGTQQQDDPPHLPQRSYGLGTRQTEVAARGALRRAWVANPGLPYPTTTPAVPLLRPRVSRGKPPPGVQVDWTHPLARGLVGVWLFNEGAGSRVYNLATGRGNQLSGTLDTSPAITRGAGGLNFPTLGANVQIASPNPTYSFGSMSMIVRGNWSTIAAQGPWLQQRGTHAWSPIMRSSFGDLVCMWNATGFNGASGLTVTTGVPNTVVAGAVGPSTALLYTTGKAPVTYSHGSAAATQTWDAVGSFGADLTNPGARYVAGLWEWAFVWADRKLSIDEIRQVEADPYGMFLTPPRQWVVISPAAGTGYTSTLSGSLTGSGSTVRAASKPLADTGTASGSITRAAAKVLADTGTASGALVKAVARALAGSASAAGVLGRAGGKVLAGACSAAGAVVKAVSAYLTGTGTPAGGVVRAASKPLTGTGTVSGSLAKGVGRSLAGSGTATGSLANAAAKVLSGVGTAAGSLGRGAGVLLAGSCSAAGSVVRAAGAYLSGSLSGAGSARRDVSAGLSGSAAGTGSVAKGVARAHAGSLAGSGSLARDAAKVLAGMATGAGSFAAVLSRVVGRWLARLVGLVWRSRRSVTTWRARAGPLRWESRPVVTSWRAVRTGLAWYGRKGMPELVDNVLVKSPGDALWRFAMDLSDLPQIRAGATISSVTSVAATPSGLTIAGAQVDSGSKAASATFSGGTEGTDYAVTFTAVLSTGETAARTGTLRVKA